MENEFRREGMALKYFLQNRRLGKTYGKNSNHKWEDLYCDLTGYIWRFVSNFDDSFIEVIEVTDEYETDEDLWL